MTPTDFVADDELILRHIPGGTTWQKPDGTIASPNFRLRPGEVGISVSRLVITSPEAFMARLETVIEPASDRLMVQAGCGRT